jgi:uncharacterized caspase-like protein
MARRLKHLGFQVTSLENASREAMEQAIVDFASRLDADAAGLFYYAGHGVQLRGRNYLIPIDAKIDSERQVRVEAVSVGLLLEEMGYARNRVNVVILDACRNNPFERRLRGASRGLAAIDAARGTMVAYATAPGSVAMDGDGSNGLYTEELLSALLIPGLSVEEVFKQVRVGVAKRTDNRQIPWESSSLVGEFVLNRPQPTPTAAPAVATTVAPSPAIAERKDLLFWESVKGSQDAAAYRAYLDQFPNGTFAALARLRVEELEDRSKGQAASGSKSTGSTERTPGKASEDQNQQLAMLAPATTRRRQIDRLLLDAEADMRALRLTSPKGNNAYERYQQVLKLEPDNLAALLGLEHVVERYLALAKRAGEKGALDKAEIYIGKAETIAPDSGSVALARRDLERLRLEGNLGAASQQSQAARTSASLTPTSPASTPGTVPGQGGLSGRPYKVVIVTPVTSIPQRRSRLSTTDIRKTLHTLVCRHNELVPYDTRSSFSTEGGRDLDYACSVIVERIDATEGSGVSVGEVESNENLWTGNFSRWVPREEAVYALGKKLNADIVFMAYYKLISAGWYTSGRFNWEGYLFDIASERAYHVQGDHTSVELDSERLLAQFLQSR